MRSGQPAPACRLLLSAAKAEIFQDQRRIRDNLSCISDRSDLYDRYVQKLDLQENQLEKLNGQLKQSQRNLEEMTKRLADYIAGLTL